MELIKITKDKYDFTLHAYCLTGDIPDRPYVMYYKGKISSKHKSVAVVGARRCSNVGKKRAIELTEHIVHEGVGVINGMAKGIDSYAHTKSILLAGNTIAVLGNGLDICYPKEHDILMERIAEHGLLLSECP